MAVILHVDMKILSLCAKESWSLAGRYTGGKDDLDKKITDGAGK